MAKKEKRQEKEHVVLDEEKAGQFLDAVFNKVVSGIPKVSKPVEELAGDYLSRYDTPEKAAKALAKWQYLKCGTSGFLTGLGGFFTLPALPATIAANIGSVAYVQMRMIAAIAVMGGYNIASDQVKTMVYVCLTGASVADVLKEAGVKVAEKGLEAAIKKIPGEVLKAINKKLGYRFLTKFGEKGIINLGKMVPVAGAVVGGAVDVVTTSVIAKNAVRLFI